MILSCMHLTMDFALYLAWDPIHLHLISIFQYIFVPKEKEKKKKTPYSTSCVKKRQEKAISPIYV